MRCHVTCESGSGRFNSRNFRDWQYAAFVISAVDPFDGALESRDVGVQWLKWSVAELKNWPNICN